MPVKSFVCLEFLNTLPKIEQDSGRGELTKYAFLDKSVYAALKENDLDRTIDLCRRCKEEIVEKELDSVSAMPSVPEKVTSDDVILDLNISKFNGTYDFESSLWKLMGDLTKSEKLKIARTKWTKYEVEPIDEKSMLYEISLSNKSGDVKAKVTPVLSKSDRNKCKEKVAEEIMKMKQDLTSNFYTPRIVRSVSVDGFGIVNCDVFVVTDQSLTCSYKVEGVTNSNIEFYQFDLTRDMMIKQYEGRIQFNPNSKNVLIGMLPNDEIAIYKPSQYNSLSGLSKDVAVEVNLSKIDKKVSSADDLQSIVLSYL